MDPQSETQARKYYIDWIRVIVFLLLILFHSAMPFVGFYRWEIRNAETSVWIDRVVIWMHQWRIPLLFFISGTGIFFSLRKRSLLAFTGERIVRLLIPLLFAMFLTIPLQVYYERMQKGEYSGSYHDFYPSVWSLVPYPDGTLTWSHMWFVVYLFVFCILLLPVFGILKWRRADEIRKKIGNALSGPFTVLLLFVPLMLIYYRFYVAYPEQMSLLDDWFVFLFSLSMLLLGYLLGSEDRFWETCEKFRSVYLFVSLLLAVFLFILYWWKPLFPGQQDGRLYLYGFLASLHIWTFILAACGFAKRHLNFSNSILQYANQAVYPFYILHQTVIVAIGYYVVQWNLPIPVKLVLLVTLSSILIWFLYHWLIRPVGIFRFLFGMKKIKKPADAPGVV
jgi:peptidoglycan/LPS O-acetylase OafA/YrhL